MEQLMEILEGIRPDIDFANEKSLVTDRLLESFDIINLVSEIDDEFDVKIKPADLVPENPASPGRGILGESGQQKHFQNGTGGQI